MIRRFLRIQRHIKSVLLAMEVYFGFTDDNLKAMEELSNTLEPLNSAALVVCKKNATIRDSERIIKITIS